MPGQRIPIGLVGASSHTNPAIETERTINLYPEINGPNAKAPAVLFTCPGLLLARDLATDVPGAGELRGSITVNERMFWVAGNSLVEWRGPADVYVWGTIPTTRDPVVISANGNTLIVGDGSGFYLFDLDARTVSVLLNDGEEPIQGWFSAYIDGRTVYLEKDTDQFFWSALDDPATVDGLSFARAEGTPDPSIAFYIVNRELVFLGTESTEFWGPTGEADNPFQRISGGFMERGCAARWGCKPFADAIVYIGRDKSGHAQVYLQGAAGGEPIPISNHGVERDINFALRDDDAEDVRCFEYTDPGHKFWVLSLPNDVTWCWDFATKLWHERAEIDSSTGKLKRIRQSHHAFWQGEHYVGGETSAKLYKQGRQYGDLDGDPLLRQRTTPIIWAQGQALGVNAVEIAMQVAVGLDGTGQGTDPVVMLQASRDGGYTFGNEITRSIGKIGETQTRVRFGPQGRSYKGFVWKLSVSDPVPVTLVDGWAEAVIS